MGFSVGSVYVPPTMDQGGLSSVFHYPFILLIIFSKSKAQDISFTIIHDED